MRGRVRRWIRRGRRRATEKRARRRTRARRMALRKRRRKRKTRKSQGTRRPPRRSSSPEGNKEKSRGTLWIGYACERSKRGLSAAWPRAQTPRAGENGATPVEMTGLVRFRSVIASVCRKRPLRTTEGRLKAGVTTQCGQRWHRLKSGPKEKGRLRKAGRTKAKQQEKKLAV